MSQDLPVSRALRLSMALAFVVTLLATGAQATEPHPAPFQLGFWPPLQIVDSERSVRGFRYNVLFGVNQDVMGLDISTFASRADGSVQGCQWALIMNLVGGDFAGIQFTGGVNQGGGDFSGVQSGALGVVGGDFTGLQLGYAGSDTLGHVRGVQLGLALASFAGELTGLQFSTLANQTKTKGRGVQLAGILNSGGSMKGLQVAGVVNVAKDLKGLQLGLLNFNKNGFLPFFPLFNFGL